MILNKVQRQNPKIIDPDLIFAGQKIRIPINRGQMSGIRGQGLEGRGFMKQVKG